MASEREGRLALKAVLGLAALAAALSQAAAFVGAAGAAPLARADAVAMRVSPYYSTADRERLARQRKENRLASRERKQIGATAPAVDYDNLPAVEDIYARKFSGNAEDDPVGGRKRYTYYVLFKAVAGDGGQEALKERIFEYIAFMKYKMSCKDIEVATVGQKFGMTGPRVNLEYPMKEYGEMPRGMKSKPKVDKAYMVEFKFAAPVQAGEYIQKKFYADNNIVRFMVVGHTRSFKHIGEDNELHL